MDNGNSSRKERKEEVLTFLFLAVFLAPALAVAGVGGLGLVLWLMQ